MKIAIVEDHEKWRVNIKKFIEKYPWKKQPQIDVFTSGEEFYNQRGYDIVFLDIEMNQMDGFETARLYKENNENAVIIFLTIHTELSRKGYLVNAFRYIDKANLREELDEALKAIEDLQYRNQMISFHVLNMGLIYIKARDILFIETDKRNTIIHTKEQEYTSNRGIDELEKELIGIGFFRSHKSYLVNLENIYQFDKIYIYFKNGSKAMVSTRKYTELKEKYMEQKFKTANF